MIWLTWRQFRAQAISVAIAFVALALVLAYTGPHLVHLYHQSGIAACQATGGDCDPLEDSFGSHFRFLHGLGVFVVVIPALIGVFWGAPLIARELETGTYRLVWTQSISRTRWLTTKLVIIGLASVITCAAFAAAIAWWSGPIDKVYGIRFSPNTFSQRGIVPVAYTAFAFALGLAAGVIIRRVIPTMAATLLVFTGVRFVVQQWVRPNFSSPVHVNAPAFAPGTVSPRAWIVSSRAVNAAGRPVAFQRDALGQLCHLSGHTFTGRALDACAARLGIHRILAIQPASRYWPFQAAEAAIFVGLAAALIVFTFAWMHRHFS